MTQLRQKKKELFTADKLTVMAGPCMLESREIAEAVLVPLKKQCQSLGVNFVFKSSFDKANRTSGKSMRGPGLREGLKILAELKTEHAVPIITDIHSPNQARQAAEVVDILQVPAFLCEDRELLHAAAQTGCTIQIKKGQYIAPERLVQISNYLQSIEGCGQIAFCERGTSFGYHNLVVDFKHFDLMKALKHPVVFDATHALQLPGAAGGASSGKRQHIPTLARAAAATKLDGFFMEVHPEPARALSDKDTQLSIAEACDLLLQVVAFDQCARNYPNLIFKSNP